MNTRIFAVLIAIALVVGGCRGGNPKGFAPVLGDGDPENDTGNGNGGKVIPPKEFSLNINASKVEPPDAYPVLLFFLLDASESIIGGGREERCKSQSPIHRDAVMRFLLLLNKIPKDKFVNLHITVARFGSRYEELSFTANEIGVKLKEIEKFVIEDSNKDQSTN